VAPKYYFTTRDLLTIAILASLGGVLSTYVGYIANTINHLVGVPYGAGQVVAGLHILWMVLILAITGKKGSGALGGFLKGFVEFISGSRLGIYVVLFSLIEGIFAEIGFWPFKKYRNISYMMSGGLGAFAYVVGQQLVNQVYDNVFLFGAVSLLSFISGAVFAGYFSKGIMDNLEDAGIVRREKEPRKFLDFSVSKAVALLLVVVIAFSAIYYFALVQLKGDPLQFTVSGDVAAVKDYYQPSLSSQFITINAKLDGDVTHLPAQDYTGLPVSYVLKDIRIGQNATKADFIGSDGYYQTFNLSEIRYSDDLIIVREDDTLRLVARGYPGQLWVSQLKEIKIY
jgi:ABC-type thiamin/hydroxymethylpyrimidine transport system permease subunit